MKGTGPLAIFIIVFVFYYAWMGNRLFSGTIEGIDNFSDMWDSFFFMFVLLTTANYPDVMLPSYNESRWYCLFFISFLVFGLYLFMNLLLAVLYATY
jgi:two pore calcium channel protein, plant